jgi:hypothetical protein
MLSVQGAVKRNQPSTATARWMSPAAHNFDFNGRSKTVFDLCDRYSVAKRHAFDLTKSTNSLTLPVVKKRKVHQSKIQFKVPSSRRRWKRIGINKHAYHSRHVTNFDSSSQQQHTVVFWILLLDTKEYPVWPKSSWKSSEHLHSQWGASSFRLSRHFFPFATGHHHRLTSDLTIAARKEKRKKECGSFNFVRWMTHKKQFELAFRM